MPELLKPLLATLADPKAASNGAYHAAPVLAALSVFGWSVTTEHVVDAWLVAVVVLGILAADVVKFTALRWSKRLPTK